MSKKVYVKPYPKEFREQVVKLVDRSALEVAREFEISVDSVRRWVQQAERDQSRRQDGLSSPEREELVRLRHHGAALSRATAPTARLSVHETVATSSHLNFDLWFAMSWTSQTLAPDTRQRQFEAAGALKDQVRQEVGELVTEGREKATRQLALQLPLTEFMAFRRHGNLAAYYDE